MNVHSFHLCMNNEKFIKKNNYLSLEMIAGPLWKHEN